MDSQTQPAVSVLTATYNRSNVLRFAVESVRCQTLPDWEMLVVGDACTDDPGDMIRAIGDPRVRFVNLPQNVGDQSGPNNEAVRLARGSSSPISITTICGSPITWKRLCAN